MHNCFPEKNLIYLSPSLIKTSQCLLQSFYTANQPKYVPFQEASFMQHFSLLWTRIDMKCISQYFSTCLIFLSMLTCCVDRKQSKNAFKWSVSPNTDFQCLKICTPTTKKKKETQKNPSSFKISNVLTQ